MRIAVIAKLNNPIKEPFVGGLEAFTHTICAKYIEYGHDVTLYARGDSDDVFHIVSFNKPEAFTSSQAEQYEADEYLRIIKDIESQQFDVVHNNSTHPLPIVWGSRASLPVVTTLHTPPYSSLKSAISLASYSSNLKFVAVSKSLLKAWQPYIHSDMSVIHNGIELSKWQPLKTKDTYVFWYGRINYNKALDVAVDLAHELQLPLQFAGPIVDTKYYQETVQPKLLDSDTYLGHLNQREINNHLRQASALVNSARWEEPFGLSTVESLASGTPVIGFDRGALREIVQENGGVIADGTTIDSLKQAFYTSQTIPFEKIFKQSKKFSVTRMVRQYVEFFEEII